MNPLGEQVLLVAKEYLGPASQQFLSKELRGLECTADTITAWHLPALSERARIAASRIMDAERADEFGNRVAGLAVASGKHGPKKASAPARDGGAPRAAMEAAARLFTSGKLRQAAFRAHNEDIDYVTIRNLVIRKMPQRAIHAFYWMSDH